MQYRPERGMLGQGPAARVQARAPAISVGVRPSRARSGSGVGVGAPCRRHHDHRSTSLITSASASGDGGGPAGPSRERGRRAALACGCAACAFALLNGATAARASAPAAGSADASSYLSRPRGGAYDEYFARAMGTMQVYEGEVAGLKRQLFRELVSDLFDNHKKKRRAAGGGGGAEEADARSAPPAILELGVGRGPNFHILAEAVREAGGDPSRGDVRVVGVDPNPAMLPYAREAADAAGFSRESVELRALYGEQLGEAFLVKGGGGDASAPFDAAVVTLVLCSVPDVARTLAELRSVVRSSSSSAVSGGEGEGDGGRLLLIEHVRDPNARSLRRLGQNVLNPLQRALADGCNLNRDTEGELRRAGLLDGASDNERRLRRLEVDGLGLLAPHLAGVLEL